MTRAKWSVKKVSEQGQAYTQTIAIKKDHFVFEILAADDRLFLPAESELKLEKVGPFNAVHFLKIRGGESPSDLQDVRQQVCLHLPVGGGHLDAGGKF